MEYRYGSGKYRNEGGSFGGMHIYKIVVVINGADKK